MRNCCGFLVLLLLGCEPGVHFVAVDLRTDLVLDREFDAVEITLDDGEPIAIDPDDAADYLAGARLAEFPMLAAGPHRLSVRLSRSGSTQVTRPIAIDVDADLAVTAVLTRDCRGVICPSDASPSAEACLGGTCVPASCVPELGEFCDAAPECTAHSDCEAGASCGVGICSAGTCIFASDDSQCGAERPYCDPDRGCHDNSRERGIWGLTTTPTTVYFGFSFERSATIGGERFTAVGASDLFIQAREPDGESIRWTRQHGSDTHEWVEDMSTLAGGDLLIGGVAMSETSFEGLTMPDVSGWDGVVAVLDQANGDAIWAQAITGEDTKASITSVAAGPDDTIYALVCFESPIDIGPLNLPATRGQDWGLMAFAPDMAGGWTPAWVLPIPAGDPRQLAANADGVFIVGGSDGDFTVGTVTTPATAERSGFVASVDPTGTVRFVDALGGAAWATLEDVAVDALGQVYVVGELDAPATIGTDALTPMGDDVLLAALESDGTPLWARVYGGSGAERGYRIAFDGGSLTWVARSGTPFDLGGAMVGDASRDVSLVYGVVDLMGEPNLAGTLPPTASGSASWLAPWAVAVTATGRICVTGRAPATHEPPFYRGAHGATHLTCQDR